MTLDGKRCRPCQRVLPHDSFGIDRSNKDGRMHRCRDCDNERSRKRDRARYVPHPRVLKTPSYNRLHRQLREQRGRAAELTCLHCGKPAHHWSYDHTDPNELQGDTGRGIIAAYSLDLNRYRPLCRSCHTLEDSGRKASDATLACLWLVARWAHQRG